VGISVAVPEGMSWYYPFGHAEGRQFDKEQVIKWAKNNLCRHNQPKIGANLTYDLDYLLHAGVNVSGPFYDVQIAEALIDENRLSYSLDSLSKDYLGEAKRQTILEEACENFGLKGKPQEHIWRLDPKYSGEYAKGDAQQALEIFEKQKIILKKEELEQVFDIETRLIPMLLHMRRTGVKIDIDNLLQLHDQLQLELETQLSESNIQGIDIWTAASIAKAFDELGLSYPLTPKTKKPSFVKGWLEKHTSEIAKKIVKCRQLDKLIGTFVEGSLLEMLIGDRVHCQFNQLKSDDYGARTGRFSCSNPNLQQIPIRTAMGKLLRQVFIPDPGYIWCKADYSQIEIRILAHYAMGAGAAAIRKAFNDNPKVDYHLWCATKAGLGKDGRDQAKTINFGIIYGMGQEKLAADLGISIEEAALFIDNYFNELPFLKETVDTATQVAEQRGYIKTILGQ
jgi:DNA polymerase I-like protein with 3'-5' exonuclease and polymerase domains